jgi:hypothetical protein
MKKSCRQRKPGNGQYGGTYDLAFRYNSKPVEHVPVCGNFAVDNYAISLGLRDREKTDE